MGIVSFEAARALRDMGYRPDNTEHVVMGYAGDTGSWAMYTTDVLTKQIHRNFVPTTDHLTALDWLENRGIINDWWRDLALVHDGPWGAELPGRVDPQDRDSDSPVAHAAAPDALLLAIAAHHAALVTSGATPEVTP